MRAPRRHRFGGYQHSRNEVLQSFWDLWENVQQVRGAKEKHFDKINSILFLHVRYITIIKATIYYFLPLTFIGILYTLMAKKLQNSAREVQNISSAGAHLKNPQAQNRRHVARMVIVFILGLFGWKIESTLPCALRKFKFFLHFSMFSSRLFSVNACSPSQISFHHLLPATLDFPALVLGLR